MLELEKDFKNPVSSGSIFEDKYVEKPQIAG